MRKCEQLNIKLEHQAMVLVSAAAEQTDMSRHDFVRTVVVGAARAVVADTKSAAVEAS